MSIDCYTFPIAVASRAARPAVEALGIADKFKFHEVDTLNGEQLKPEFIKYPRHYGGEGPKDSLQKLQDASGFLNTFLEEQKYVAGDNLSIADLSLVATVSTIEAVGVSIDEYPNIIRWYALMKTTTPNYEKANGEPLIEFKTLFESKK